MNLKGDQEANKRIIIHFFRSIRDWEDIQSFGTQPIAMSDKRIFEDLFIYIKTLFLKR